MTEPTIICPKCHEEIKLTESLAAPLIKSVRHEYEERLLKQKEGLEGREKALRDREEALSKARESLDDQVAEKLKLERAKIASEEAKKARLASANDLEQKAKEVEELQSVLQQREAKLAEAQNAQAELIRKQRELDDAKRELDLTVEKRIQEGLTTARDQARKEAEEELKLKVLDKEQVISALQKQIEDLKRRADQGSQQAQGEVMELELETILRAKFPRDLIEPVPKGEFGGDVLHRVLGPLGQPCGTILWESKRTKNWTDSWLPKLREDQRAAKAEVAILMSQALPKDVDTFELIDGVWVTHPRTALPVADMLRHSLLEVALARHRPTKNAPCPKVGCGVHAALGKRRCSHGRWAARMPGQKRAGRFPALRPVSRRRRWGDVGGEFGHAQLRSGGPGRIQPLHHGKGRCGQARGRVHDCAASCRSIGEPEGSRSSERGQARQSLLREGFTRHTRRVRQAGALTGDI